MTHPPPKSAALVATAALALTACGGSTEGTTSSDPASGGGDVALTWWHNSNTGAGKDYYDKVAADFEAANPGVTITVEALQHEDMGTKIEAAWQSGDMPDIYMERGGGELADKGEAGLVKDLSEAAAETSDKLGGAVQRRTGGGRTTALPLPEGRGGLW